jgi:glycosyltransferase involved in cell wall biosynthesis
MRVLFNGASALRRRTGVGHTAWQLYHALVRLAPQDHIWLYPGVWWHRRLARFRQAAASPQVSRPVSRPLSAPAPKWLRQWSWQLARGLYAAHFHLAARLGRFDLYHEPNLVPFAVPIPTVVTVHDLSVLLYPQWHPPERVRRHEAAFARGVARAAHILVDSEAVRQEAVRHLGVSPVCVTTVYCGIAEHFRPASSAAIAALRQRWHLPPRYLLYVGTIEPRKNVLTLLRAYCDLPPTVREHCPLVLGGLWGWKSEPERQFWEEIGQHRGVRYLGYVADEDLPALYSGATALLYPSYYEGFGLPPLEMMACGGAAIISTAASLQEIAGGNAVALDPHDLPAWRKAMERSIREPEWLDDYRRRGPHYAAAFRWDRAAKTVLEVYHRVLKRPLRETIDDSTQSPSRQAA